MKPPQKLALIISSCCLSYPVPRPQLSVVVEHFAFSRVNGILQGMNFLSWILLPSISGCMLQIVTAGSFNWSVDPIVLFGVRLLRDMRVTSVSPLPCTLYFSLILGLQVCNTNPCTTDNPQ